MDPEAFNDSMRKFLRTVGVTSQREIEAALAKALELGAVAGHEVLPASMTLKIPGLELDVTFTGEIRLG